MLLISVVHVVHVATNKAQRGVESGQRFFHVVHVVQESAKMDNDGQRLDNDRKVLSKKKPCFFLKFKENTTQWTIGQHGQRFSIA